MCLINEQLPSVRNESFLVWLFYSWCRDICNSFSGATYVFLCLQPIFGATYVFLCLQPIFGATYVFLCLQPIFGAT